MSKTARLLTWLVFPMALVSVACGASMSSRAGASGACLNEVRIELLIRRPEEQGYSRETQSEFLANHLVELLDRNRNVLEVRTDETGLAQAPFCIETVRLAAEATEGQTRLWVSPQANGNEPYRFSVVASPTISFGPDSDEAGALHILRVLQQGVSAANRWTHNYSPERTLGSLPPFFVHWHPGETTEWSYYHGERPRGSGHFALELMATPFGRADVSDTDQFDDSIILHELGHFVFDRWSGDSSTGGTHPGGTYLNPGIAWEEGRANFFACSVMGTSIYQDAVGIVPRGSRRVHDDLESHQPPSGNGAEDSVASVLWDLADGSEDPSLNDRDDDGISLGREQVFQMLLRPSISTSYVSIASFLQDQILGNVDASRLARMLATTNEPSDLLTQEWPSVIVSGTPLAGLIDGISGQAPSGGRAFPESGFDAVRSYQFTVAQTSFAEINLVIQGRGDSSDHTDVDIELRDARVQALDRSVGTSSRESIVRRLEPGNYMIIVRDGGGGNRANYQLSLQVQPIR